MKFKSGSKQIELTFYKTHGKRYFNYSVPFTTNLGWIFDSWKCTMNNKLVDNSYSDAMFMVIFHVGSDL